MTYFVKFIDFAITGYQRVLHSIMSPFFSDNLFWDRLLLIVCATVIVTGRFWVPMIWDHYLEAFKPIKDYLRLQSIQQPDGSYGLLYEYQGLAAGVLAVIAGLLALTVPIISYALDACKKRNDFLKKIRAIMIVINAQFQTLLHSENPHSCNYNIQELSNINVSFLTGDYYWTLSHDEAYAAHTIMQGIETGKRALLGYKPIDETGQPNIWPLNIALLNFCIALDRAEEFMSASFDNKLEILAFMDNPSLIYFKDKAQSPIFQYFNKG